MKYYSPSTNGFYTPEVNHVMPEDVVEITDEYWSTLIGNNIEFNGTIPVIKESISEISTVNKMEYATNRRNEYPYLSDFADAYYWSQRGKPELMEEYLAKCDAVKEKYPKPQN